VTSLLLKKEVDFTARTVFLVSTQHERELSLVAAQSGRSFFFNQKKVPVHSLFVSRAVNFEPEEIILPAPKEKLSNRSTRGFSNFSGVHCISPKARKSCAFLFGSNRPRAYSLRPVDLRVNPLLDPKPLPHKSSNPECLDTEVPDLFSPSLTSGRKFLRNFLVFLFAPTQRKNKRRTEQAFHPPSVVFVSRLISY
jgi:hypothetical protein